MRKKPTLVPCTQKKEQMKPENCITCTPPNRWFLNSARQAEINGGGNILRWLYGELPALARSGMLACTVRATMLLNLGFWRASHSKKYPPLLKNHDASSAIISESSLTQRLSANAASQGHRSLSQDPPMWCTSNRVGWVNWHLQRPACHHPQIGQFFIVVACTHFATV